MSTSPRMGPRAVISAEYFHQFCNTSAYRNWKLREGWRRDRDWNEALGELGWYCVYRKDSRFPVVQAKAHEIYLWHKDADKDRDWFDAEQELLEGFVVVVR